MIWTGIVCIIAVMGLFIASAMHKRQQKSIRRERMELLEKTEKKLPEFKKKEEKILLIQAEITKQKPERLTLYLKSMITNFRTKLESLEKVCTDFRNQDALAWNQKDIAYLNLTAGYQLDGYYEDIRTVHENLVLSDRDLVMLERMRVISRQSSFYSGRGYSGGIF